MLGLTEDKLIEMFEHAPLPMHILDTKGTLRWVNRQWQFLMGFRSAEVLGKQLTAFIAPGSSQDMEGSFQTLLDKGSLRDQEIKLTRKDGAALDISANSRVIYDNDKALYTHYILFDISKRKHMEQKLKDMSLTDYLTGLYNRSAILDILETEIKRLDRYGGELSILLVSINHMDGIINNYGHSVGDRAVIQAGESVVQYKRLSDSVGRYGGDKFIVVLPETGADGALVYAERLAYGISVPVGDGNQITVTLSLGIAEFNEDVLDSDSLVRNATDAMQDGREEGKSSIAIYGG